MSLFSDYDPFFNSFGYGRYPYAYRKPEPRLNPYYNSQQRPQCQQRCRPQQQPLRQVVRPQQQPQRRDQGYYTYHPQQYRNVYYGDKDADETGTDPEEMEEVEELEQVPVVQQPKPKPSTSTASRDGVSIPIRRVNESTTAQAKPVFQQNAKSSTQQAQAKKASNQSQPASNANSAKRPADKVKVGDRSILESHNFEDPLIEELSEDEIRANEEKRLRSNSPSSLSGYGSSTIVSEDEDDDKDVIETIIDNPLPAQNDVSLPKSVPVAVVDTASMEAPVTATVNYDIEVSPAEKWSKELELLSYLGYTDVSEVVKLLEEEYGPSANSLLPDERQQKFKAVLKTLLSHH